jgi:hypothetical protein
VWCHSITAANSRVCRIPEYVKASSDRLGPVFLPLATNLGRLVSADSVEKLGYKMVDFLALSSGDDWIASVIHVFRGFCSGFAVFDRI